MIPNLSGFSMTSSSSCRGPRIIYRARGDFAGFKQSQLTRRLRARWSSRLLRGPSSAARNRVRRSVLPAVARARVNGEIRRESDPLSETRFFHFLRHSLVSIDSSQYASSVDACARRKHPCMSLSSAAFTSSRLESWRNHSREHQLAS